MILKNTEKFIKAINNSYSIAIVSHVNPDGDSVGSSLALYHCLKKLGKEVHIFCQDNISEKLKSVLNCSFYNTEQYENYDLAIAVDCADIFRLGDKSNLFSTSLLTVVIDHHISNNKFGNLNFIDASASATAEVMYELILALGDNLMDKTIAEALYVGLITDSGGFSFSSVSSNTMRIASELLKFNVVADKLFYDLIKKKKLNNFKLASEALNNAKFYYENKVGILTFKTESFTKFELENSSTEGIINNILDIDGVEIAVAITQSAIEEFKVSFRTKTVDAQKLAGFFGGGGHARAAGCKIKLNYADVLSKILAICSENL